MYGNWCESDCRSRGREYDLGPVPYFHGDWSWIFLQSFSSLPLNHQEGLLSVTSKSTCTNYWLTACSSLPRKTCGQVNERPPMTIAVDLGRNATKHTKSIWLIKSLLIPLLFYRWMHESFQNDKTNVDLDETVQTAIHFKWEYMGESFHDYS